LQSQQNDELFMEIEKGSAAEAEALREMEREIVALDAVRFQDKQKEVSQNLQRAQKKQAWTLEQELRTHSKTREKVRVLI
jgi:hypothetical protein